LLGEYENVISGIIYNATGGDVTDVFVNGRRLVRDGVLTSIDVSALSARVRETAEKIVHNLGVSQ
jgi:5-methylthioadenosine/S-adenosylhomocysteine deaminase